MKFNLKHKLLGRELFISLEEVWPGLKNHYIVYYKIKSSHGCLGASKSMLIGVGRCGGSGGDTRAL